MERAIVDKSVIREIQEERSDRLKALVRAMSRPGPMPPKARIPPARRPRPRSVERWGKLRPFDDEPGRVLKQ